MTRFLILSFIFLLVFSCGKNDRLIKPEPEPLFPGSQEYGWAKGMKNGDEWEASAVASYHSDDSTYAGMIIDAFNANGFLRESIGFNEIPIKVGMNTIRGTAFDVYDGFIGNGYDRWGSDGDVLTARYILDEDYNNTLEITKVDLSTETIEGVFSARYDIEFDNRPYPEIVEFKNIKFSAQITQ